MNKKILYYYLLSIILFLPVNVMAAIPGAVGSPKLNAILSSIQNAAIGLGATMAVIGFIIAGIIWLTSGGSPEKTGTARKALIAAVIGTALLVVGASAGVFITMINEIICGGGAC